MMTEHGLKIDFDDTDHVMRIWDGAELAGELRPRCAVHAGNVEPESRWVGWLSCDAVVEIVSAYNAICKIEDRGIPLGLGTEHD